MIRIFLILLISSQAIAQTNIEKAKKLWDSKNNSEAKKILSAIDSDNKDYAAAQYYLGRISASENNFEEASDYFEEAVDANDKVAEYYTWLGNMYATIAQNANPISQGMLAPKMRNAWEKSIELDPNNLDSRRSLIQYYLQAPSFMGGSFEKAKEMAMQIMKLKPADGHLQMGNIFLKEKKPEAAEKEFVEATKSDPNYILALGNFYIIQKQFDKAFTCFEDALKTNSENYIILYQIGKTSALSGQKLDRGEECLKRYLNYKPKQNEPPYSGANLRLGQIYEKKGNKVEAKIRYELALNMDSKLKEAKEGLERVSK